jgi:DinB superfamily
MQSETLIQSFMEETRQAINKVEQLQGHELHRLTWKPNPNSWSILECVEHLNLYGDFYLPEIERQIKKSKTASESAFKSGMLGNYFANSMLPKEKLNKMKTFKDKNPLHAQLDKSVLDRFIQQQMKLLDLLSQARNVSLNKVKVPTSFSSLVKLKLGDIFRFLTNHMIRHFKQIDGIEAAMKNA